MADALTVAGTFLPIVGSLLTLVLGLTLTGRSRWAVLVAIPAVTGLVCWLVASAVFENGNLLAAVLYLAYAVAFFVYYPVLVIVAVLMRLRRRVKFSGSAQ
jgi:hypothetical protein